MNSIESWRIASTNNKATRREKHVCGRRIARTKKIRKDRERERERTRGGGFFWRKKFFLVKGNSEEDDFYFRLASSETWHRPSLMRRLASRVDNTLHRRETRYLHASSRCRSDFIDSNSNAFKKNRCFQKFLHTLLKVKHFLSSNSNPPIPLSLPHRQRRIIRNKRREQKRLNGKQASRRG